ncbi:MAG: phosphatase PAP2 family protein [Desulfobacterales bacterium]|nr:phosphatase PAP2 family protein [Desulfobacterales bacterium]
MAKRLKLELLIVGSGLILCTALIRLTGADLGLARLVVGPDNRWPGVGSVFWKAIYNYANLPAIFLAGGAALCLLAGSFVPRLLKYRRFALFLVLLLALGPGLIVNVVLKDNWGRARPGEIVEFGGQHQYTHILRPGDSGPNSSFPSGHAAVAFFLIAPYFYYRTRSRRVAVSFLLLGLGWGLLTGAARILQGGHFLSDVLWAGGIVYLTGALLAALLALDREP